MPKSTTMKSKFAQLALAMFLSVCVTFPVAIAQEPPVRVFIFAGQSNMEGADSRAKHIQNFPPFRGLDVPQEEVLFSYCIGRENKQQSDQWQSLKPVNNMVGPELSFARRVGQATDAKIAIIKIAAGGTHLGGDWNPDQPSGFKLYPLALKWVRDALADLDAKGIKYQLEGFMWHQGENDMFNEQYKLNYGKNLRNFVASWRRDLKQPKLRFYVGELCTKTIWGMDLRPRMYAISLGQHEVTDRDELVDFVPTSHVAVEIGNGVGLHYHYGTLGQLEHGENYAQAYLKNIGKWKQPTRSLKKWPYKQESAVKLFVMLGHRNMEGERAFVQELDALEESSLCENDASVAFRYSLGGGYRRSEDWEPLGPVGYYDTFGPELSFARSLRDRGQTNFAIAKFTHSGSQIIDWTPEGSMAKSRNLYQKFIAFTRQSIKELQSAGHTVELAGIFYHVGENDMSWGPFRKMSATRVRELVQASRTDLDQPELHWFISQQPPTDDKRVNNIDALAKMKEQFSSDPNCTLLQWTDMPPQPKKLVLNTEGVVWLGDQLAKSWLTTTGQAN